MQHALIFYYNQDFFISRRNLSAVLACALWGRGLRGEGDLASPPAQRRQRRQHDRHDDLATLCRPPGEGHRWHIEAGIDAARGPRVIGETTDRRTRMHAFRSSTAPYRGRSAGA